MVLNIIKITIYNDKDLLVYLSNFYFNINTFKFRFIETLYGELWVGFVTLADVVGTSNGRKQK